MLKARHVALQPAGRSDQQHSSMAVEALEVLLPRHSARHAHHAAAGVETQQLLRLFGHLTSQNSRRQTKKRVEMIEILKA